MGRENIIREWVKRGIGKGDKEGTVSMKGKWVGRLRRWEGLTS